MVGQNYVIYVNDKRIIRQCLISLKDVDGKLHFEFNIPEKHLVCGLILSGVPVKGEHLREFPFRPIEKYMFEISNIFFQIPEIEFSVENLSYDFNVNKESIPLIEFLVPKCYFFEMRTYVAPNENFPLAQHVNEIPPNIVTNPFSSYETITLVDNKEWIINFNSPPNVIANQNLENVNLKNEIIVNNSELIGVVERIDTYKFKFWFKNQQGEQVELPFGTSYVLLISDQNFVLQNNP